MNQPFFSHSEPIPNSKQRKGNKLLIIHTEGVSKIALNSFSDYVNFDVSISTLKSILKLVCNLHDLGKYTSFFQTYLLRCGKIDWVLKQHARFGAYVAYEKLKKETPIWAIKVFYLINLHHSSLKDFLDMPAIIADKSNKRIFDAQKKDVIKNIEKLIAETTETRLKDMLVFPDKKEFRQIVRTWIKTKSNIQNYFLINYLFSLLIEADKLDASRTEQYPRVRIPQDLVNNHILKITNGKINPKDLRNVVRQRVLSNLKNEKNFLKIRLFTLTAPTGIGKTLTSLDFALQLRALLPNNPQIIYGLPFINIIEQAIDVYSEVIPEHAGKVLAHYQYADAVGQQKKYEEKEGDKNYEQKLKTLDCWQSDIVITTFVQVLQTIIGNKNRLLKRFNHFAGAILILDEVQTIRLEYQPLIGAALFYLSKFLDTRIIMMTATKPKIFELANHILLKPDNEEAKAFELLKGYEWIFKDFKRTAIHLLIENEIIEEREFIEQYFDKYWKKNKSCLVVCNTVKRSVDLFNEIELYVQEKGLPNNVYYLSTNIVPCERVYIIDRVKLDIKHGKKPILISTQSIEAGVDLDFDIGFRDLAPIDSIVQVAGRINRNGKKKEFSELYIVKFSNGKKSDCERIYDDITESQAIKALTTLSDNLLKPIIEPQYLELVDEYYNLLTDFDNKKVSFDDSIKIFDSMKVLRYDGEITDKIKPVSAFKVIEENGYAMSVFIEIDEYSSNVANKYRKLLDKEDKDFNREQFEKYKKDFHQRIIAVPKYVKNAEKLIAWANEEEQYKLSEDIFCIPLSDIQEFYNYETGFIRTPEDRSVSAIY